MGGEANGILYCVAAIIARPDSSVLLLQRDHARYGQGLLCLPGGKLRKGRTIKGWVGKEIFQETGYELGRKDLTEFGVVIHERPDGVTVVSFLYTADEPAGRLQLNEESSSYAWCLPRNLAQPRLAFSDQLEALVRFWNVRGVSLEGMCMQYPLQLVYPNGR